MSEESKQTEKTHKESNCIFGETSRGETSRGENMRESRRVAGGGRGEVVRAKKKKEKEMGRGRRKEEGGRRKEGGRGVERHCRCSLSNDN
jgi:hypothetical protein